MSGAKKSQVLAFGIPTLDNLIGAPPEPSGSQPTEYGIHLGKSNEPISICIIGPDGTGKSVLGLHFTSYYASYVASEKTHVLYVSTDLSLDRADTIWKNFGLNVPGERSQKTPFQFSKNSGRKPHVGSVNLEPANPDNLADYLMREDKSPKESPKVGKVAFVDLAANTAGDDWGFLHRLLAALDYPEDGQPRHLLVIDAVEGLEVLVGNKDAYGLDRERRSYLAQIIRTAAKKCHVLLIVEETKTLEHVPEEFVTDVVVRLRTTLTRDYSRRTVEIDKVRGQSHIRGQHDFTIRDGKGVNPKQHDPHADDPEIKLSDGQYLSYVHVFHSLHKLNRVTTRNAASMDGVVRRTGFYTGFGIRYLDEMLAGSSNVRNNKMANLPNIDPAGLPAGAVTAIIGDDGTHKSRLARAFLSQCFAKESGKQGIAILVTTQNITTTTLGEMLKAHLATGNIAPDRILCRRLPIHYASPAVLIHIIRCIVKEAQECFFGKSKIPKDQAKRREACGDIRLVIDDWSVIQSYYPEIKDNPIFLPYLCLFLRQEGISTLIVDTQYGGPNRILIEEKDQELRALVDHHLYTWHVPFFGERRVAITAIPPIADNHPSTIRELRPHIAATGNANPEDVEHLEVDPHFEMYTGLEKDTPKPVSLQIRLFCPAGISRNYSDETDLLLRQLYPAVNKLKKIVVTENISSYETLRDFSYLQNDTYLNYTLVFQVDEFWAESRAVMADQSNYLWAETVVNHQERSMEDPFAVFQPTKGDASGTSRKLRKDFFTPIGHDYDKYSLKIKQGEQPVQDMNVRVDKIPYVWDFGFLMCSETAWKKAETKKVKGGKTVWDIYQALSIENIQTAKKHSISWREFMQACVFTAQAQVPGKKPVYPFDVDLTAIESFSCLVLEIWASEIACRKSSRRKSSGVFCKNRHPDDREIKVGTADEDKIRVNMYGPSLLQLAEEYKEELFRTWLLLSEVFTTDQFRADGHYIRVRPSRSTAVAVRHWYSTACTVKNTNSTKWTPLSLPGKYSVRGDWFLAVAKGSRSMLLGERAIDLLCSRRANIVRAQDGIGLPVRELYTTNPRHDELWTPLTKFESDGTTIPILYKDLRVLGAADQHEDKGQTDFDWIWRSMIRYYDRHTRTWQKWLCKVLHEWKGVRMPNMENFKLYDDNVSCSDARAKDFKDFHEILISILARATHIED